MRPRYLLPAAALALLSQAAYAQQPTLPGAPTVSPAPVAAPAPVPTALPAAAPATPPGELVLGHRYEVKLQSGVSFTGALQAMSPIELTFSAVGLGNLSVKRDQIVQLQDLDAALPSAGPAAGRQRSYYDIGTGSRYFFGPSGRNLRQGEGVAQDVWLYLAGVNYGVTDNFSIGGYLSLVPGLSLSNQVLVLTPKIGFEVGHDLNLGAGTIFLRVPSGDGEAVNVGLLYGVATRGSADHNVSLGVGYGYAGGNVGSTPTLYLAGQTRVSRRISLMSENYVVAAENPVLFGIYGLKINWRRVGMGIASGYVGYIDNAGKRSGQEKSYFYPLYVLPVYLDVSFRFGKPHQNKTTSR